MTVPELRRLREEREEILAVPDDHPVLVGMSEKVDNVALQVIVRKLDAVFLVLTEEDDLAARDVDGLPT